MTAEPTLGSTGPVLVALPAPAVPRLVAATVLASPVGFLDAYMIKVAVAWSAASGSRLHSGAAPEPATPSEEDTMDSLSGSTVVVIGGTSGIGLETARQAHAAKAKLILTGRDRERLESVRDELGASTATLDLGDTAGLHRFFAEMPAPVDHVLVTGAPRSTGRSPSWTSIRRAVCWTSVCSDR